jgi:hypothetical protein
MSVRNNECGNESKNNFVMAKSSLGRKKIVPALKFKASFERRIERLWCQSSDLGWSYNDFVGHLLEVLIVLQHRDSSSRAAASKRSVAS